MTTIYLPIAVPGTWAPPVPNVMHGFGLAPVKQEGGSYRMEPWSLWDVSFAVPNGVHIAGSAKGRARHMAALKKRGLKPGVSDIVIAYPAGGFHGMFLEMKRDNQAPVSDEQKRFQELMRAVGYHCVIARGYQNAVDHIQAYLRSFS
jgi:hypothetical protein